MKLESSLLLAGLAIALTACNLDVADSSTVSSQGIYQRYSVPYDESQGTLSSSAEFLSGGAGGSSVDLQAPAGVSFDGQGVQKEAFLGLTYQTSDQRGFSQNHSWIYTDSSGTTYTNSITIVPIELGSVPTLLNRGSDTSFAFNGPPLGDGESVTIYLSVTTSSGLTIGYVPTDVAYGSNSGTIHAADLSTYGSGLATFQISRNRTTGLQQSTEQGGSISAQYLSQTASTVLP